MECSHFIKERKKERKKEKYNWVLKKEFGVKMVRKTFEKKRKNYVEVSVTIFVFD